MAVAEVAGSGTYKAMDPAPSCFPFLPPSQSLQIEAMFTTLFIAREHCMPNVDYKDYKTDASALTRPCELRLESAAFWEYSKS